jgi:hypothetical protein
LKWNFGTSFRIALLKSTPNFGIFTAPSLVVHLSDKVMSFVPFDRSTPPVLIRRWLGPPTDRPSFAFYSPTPDKNGPHIQVRFRCRPAPLDAAALSKTCVEAWFPRDTRSQLAPTGANTASRDLRWSALLFQQF